MKNTLGQVILFAMIILGGTLFKMMTTINTLKK
jgi:hypothetical protein